MWANPMKPRYKFAQKIIFFLYLGDIHLLIKKLAMYEIKT